ncbi:MAG: TonB-dependent receptor, partial [Novosphingobium sp.]|nr:TonB-dependent receptor [Novosphingobium sp.]
PLGGQTSLFVRGAGSEQVLVLIDGVRVNDVASPGGAYDFGNLMTGGIGKVELLRGSNSVVWGSQAIGGVLALTTREVNGAEATAEYGSHDSFDGQINAGIASERYSLGVMGGYTRTDGVSSAAAGTERDGFRQWRIGARGRAELVPGLSAVATARHADSRIDMDGYPAPAYVFADTPEYQKTRETSGRAGLEYAGEALLLNGGFALSDIRRAYYDPTWDDAPNYVTRGRSQRADLSGHYDFTPALRLNFGADSEWSRFSVSGSGRHRARLSSGHALLGWRSGGLSLAAGVRYDDHSRFGDEWTFGANGSVAIAEGWRVRASYGEGFKAPTLYQLFSDYGNMALLPERSRSYEAGIAKGDRNAGLHFAVTAFRRISRNLIDYVSCFSSSDPICSDGRFGFYDNVGRARAQGVEVELGAQLGETLHAQAAYTYLDAENRTVGSAQFGNALARRPRHTVTVSADWTSALHGLVLGGDIRMVSDSFDDAGNFTRNESHVLATLRASLPLNDALELFGRVENVADTRHATVAGYGSPGRAVTGGVRARF